MFKKLFPLVFIIFFIGVFSYFNGEDFFEHQRKQQELTNEVLETQGQIENFSLDNIREIEDTQFYYTPYKDLLDKIVSKINGAEQRVYVEVYMLTETRIKAALVHAHRRGIDVKVVLEHSPYLAVNLNQKHFKELEEKGVNIVWSNPKNYALNHSKIMLIDNELLLSTGNFTYSTFAHNRDLFIVTKDVEIVKVFLEIFNKDFIGEKYPKYNNNIVLSPDYSRDKFEKIIEGASQSIKMYAQYLKDDKMLNILYKKAKEGIHTEIILSKNGYDNYNEEKDSEIDKIHMLNVLPINNKAKMHSKAILIDEKYLFIGSVNFSTSSLDENREMGILLKNKKIIDKFVKLFNSDM